MKLRTFAVLLSIVCLAQAARLIWLGHHFGRHCYIIAHNNRPYQTETAFNFGFICGWYAMGTRRGDLFEPPTDLMGRLYPLCQDVVAASNKRVESARTLVDRLQSLKESK